MPWVIALSVGVAVVLTFSPVPLWAKLLCISVAATALMAGLLRDIPKPARWRRWVGHRRLLLGVMPLLVFVNVLCRVYDDHAWDLSQIRLYSLRQDSVDWLSRMRVPVAAHIFLRSDDKTTNYVGWLRESAAKLGAPLSVEVHNINRDIILADHYDVNKVGETVLVAGDRWVKMPDFKETSIVTGLARLFSREGSAICFVAGHGEPDVTSESQDGLRRAAKALESIGYNVRTVNIMDGDEKTVLSRCGLMAIIGPSSEFFPNELIQIRALWGKLPILIAVDTPAPASLAALLGEQGVVLGGHLLMEPGNADRAIPATNLSVDAGSSPLLTGLRGSVFLPRVQSVAVESDAWSTVLSTDPTRAVVEGETNARGPFGMAVARDGGGETSRIAVLGSSRPFLNANWGFANNAPFFLQIGRWLINEDVISVPEHLLVKEPIMDLSSAQVGWINAVVFYMLPGGVLLACLFLWWRHQWA